MWEASVGLRHAFSIFKETPQNESLHPIHCLIVAATRKGEKSYPKEALGMFPAPHSNAEGDSGPQVAGWTLLLF